MDRTKLMEENGVIVKVLPSEVKRLHDDEIIMVSRTQLNAQMALSMMCKKDEKTIGQIKIMRCAIDDMLKQEQQKKAIVMGAPMKVKDVKNVFSKIEKMPSSSFAKITD